MRINRALIYLRSYIHGRIAVQIQLMALLGLLPVLQIDELHEDCFQFWHFSSRAIF